MSFALQPDQISQSLKHSSGLITRRAALLIALVFSTAGLGCGAGGPTEPPLAAVSGTVTLDGKPLPDALVKFESTDGQAGLSQGITDKDGKYSLKYKGTTDGAPIGTCRVRISNANEADTPADKMLPPKFSRDSTMTKDVASGPNTIDFELTSK